MFAVSQKNVHWWAELGDNRSCVKNPKNPSDAPFSNNHSTESLKDYFSQFGEVQECTVMRDGATGRSRGFGFLTFRDPKTVNVVMVKEHYLDGKIVSSLYQIPFHQYAHVDTLN